MPGKSSKQRRAAGAALAAKRGGKMPRKGGAAHDMAMSMSEEELARMASKPMMKGSHKGGKKRGKAKVHPKPY